jgi:O-methyltransferase involved in polyketide biosynthesis
MTNVFASRTRFFDGFFADAATAGIRHAVIVASGWMPSLPVVVAHGDDGV